MLELVFWVGVGAFIGWNLPQPWWAAAIQSKIMSFMPKVMSFMSRGQ